MTSSETEGYVAPTVRHTVLTVTAWKPDSFSKVSAKTASQIDVAYSVVY